MKSQLNTAAVLFSKDIEIMAKFYEGAFSLSKIYGDNDKVVLESSNFTITIHAIPKQIADGIKISEPPEVRESTPIKLCFPVESIDTTRNKATEFGGKVYPIEKQWENDKFVACDGFDPEGNVYQVREVK